jgi:methylenetetrahydrofolate reductase (NADPH)
MNSPSPELGPVRYEILPFASGEEEARGIAQPLALTVTCSPRQGMDGAVNIACRLRELGHAVVIHLAARMVRDESHLDRLLERLTNAGVVDVFLIGGDASRPVGAYESAMDLLPELRAHPLRPRSIGIAAYPEGHPLIDPDTLFDALAEKAPWSDYMTTQLCFDSDAILDWLRATRDSGIQLPVYLGLPGVVDGRRLLEISIRVGVGASLSFLRKQHGLRRFLARRQAVTEHLHAELAPLVGRELGFTSSRSIDSETRCGSPRTAQPGWASTRRPPMRSREE